MLCCVMSYVDTSVEVPQMSEESIIATVFLRTYYIVAYIRPNVGYTFHEWSDCGVPVNERYLRSF